MEFLKPATLQEAITALSDDPYGSKVIAGGTAVVLMIRNGLIAPERLVSLARIPGLTGVAVEGNAVHIGALTPLRTVAGSDTVRRNLPALADACSVVGNVRIRNQATLGGNLAEADYASDPPAVLAVLDANVSVTGPQGSREIPVRDLLLGFYTTALEPDELITDIIVPLPSSTARTTYLKYKSRSSEDRPCVGVAALATFDGESCTDLRIAVGAACETPQRLPEVEGSARGGPLSDIVIDEVATAYADTIDTLEDLRGSAWYRKEMIRVHVRRALEEVRNGDR